MNLQRKLTLVVVTGAVALGAGHYVQEKAGDRLSADLPEVVVSDVRPVAAGPEDIAPRAAAAQPPALPAEAAPFVTIAPTVVPQPAPAPVPPASVPPAQVLASAGPIDLTPPTLSPELAPEMAIADECAVKLDVLAQPDAMIGISLLAPCQAEQRVVLKHAGIAVTGRTSASGALVTTIPAITAIADVEVLFPSGEKARGSVPTADFAGLQRFAVQWQDKDAFQLHAFENGAGYDQPGHISAAYAGTSGVTGYVTVLGDASVELPLLAEVYTFGDAEKTEIVLEAAITTNTCGREILGEAIFAAAGSVEISDLTLAMPACDAVGDILVLKNLLEDMTLASAN